MGLFIAFEGGEGGGKSTQARALHRRLARLGLPVVLTHEPGGTALGNNLRRWLKQARELTAPAEFFLFAASRAQLAAEVIGPHLSQGGIVICDRFAPSSVAYQGHARGLDPGLIQAANEIATQGLRPDLLVLLDMAPEEGLGRKGSAKRDRFEREKVAFHRRVREGYLEMARADPQRWLVVDASLPRAQVTKIIWARVSQLLSQRRS